jgi:hypothetical protein
MFSAALDFDVVAADAVLEAEPEPPAADPVAEEPD